MTKINKVNQSHHSFTVDGGFKIIHIEAISDGASGASIWVGIQHKGIDENAFVPFGHDKVAVVDIHNRDEVVAHGRRIFDAFVKEMSAAIR